MNSEKILRLRYIDFGLRESKKRLNGSLKINDRNSLQIAASLYEVIFWIDSNNTWHYHNSKKYDYENARNNSIGGKSTIGLRGVINSLKHNMNFTKVIRAEEGKPFLGSNQFQIEDYSTPIIWLNAENIIDSTKNEYQFDCYKECLEGKQVISTIEKSISFLNKFNREIYSLIVKSNA